jgi:hypothetical protein
MSGVEVEAMLGVKATSDVEAVFEMEDRQTNKSRGIFSGSRLS